MSKYSILALTGDTALFFVLAAVAIIALIAIAVGASKGFSRIGWGALCWGVGCGLFYLFETKLHDKSPVLKLGAVQKAAAGVQDFAASVFWAIVAVLTTLVLYGIFALIFRSRRATAGGVPDEDEDIDDDDEDLDEDEIAAKAAAGKPVGQVDRLFGVIAAVLNALIVSAAAVCTLLVIFNVTPLRSGVLQPLYESDFLKKVWNYVHTYTLDFLFLAIIVALAYGGYRSGFIVGFRSVFLVVGIIVSLIVGFWLPFSSAASEKEWLSVVGSLSGWISSRLTGALGEGLAAFVGKLGCGLILCVVLCVMVLIVWLLLRLIERAVRFTGALRVLDGFLSVVVAVVLGVLLCGLIGAVLYSLDYFNVFDASGLFTEDSSFANGLFAVFDQYLKPVFDKIKGTVA